MDIETALDFLDSHVEVALATCEEGSPRIRIFQIMQREGTTLYFATSPVKAVYRQLQVDPRIEIVSLADRVSVRCSGKAHFDVDEERSRRIYDHTPVLQRLYSSYDKLVCFALPIARLDYYDLRPTPPIFRHYNLEAGTEGSGFIGERFAK